MNQSPQVFSKEVTWYSQLNSNNPIGEIHWAVEKNDKRDDYPNQP
jgi:hypothetical protein